jgi:hypothetical protein
MRRLLLPLVAVMVMGCSGAGGITASPGAGGITASPSAGGITASPTAPPEPTPVPSGAGGSFDPCALLTTAELSKILGDISVQGKALPSGGWMAGRCDWEGPAYGFVVIVGTAASFAAYGDPEASDARAEFALFKAASSTPKDVAGIGDGAVVSELGIAAYRGGTLLEITNYGGGLTEDQLIEMAKLALARL